MSISRQKEEEAKNGEIIMAYLSNVEMAKNENKANNNVSEILIMYQYQSISMA